jgi:hypothetical protein
VWGRGVLTAEDTIFGEGDLGEMGNYFRGTQTLIKNQKKNSTTSRYTKMTHYQFGYIKDFSPLS